MTTNTLETILFANTAEAFKDILLEAGSDAEGKRRIRHELALSQRAFFWEGDNKVVVTPHPIPTVLLEHNIRAFGLKNVVNISPKDDRVDLCEAMMGDSVAWEKLVETIKVNPGVSVSSYAITKDFKRLVEKLRSLNLEFSVPELPDNESIWTIDYLDSKSGYREDLLKVAAKHDDVRLPKGFICSGLEQAVQMMRWFMQREISCVVKSNVGESGWGTLILRKSEFNTLSDVENKVRETLSSDSIWNRLPLVVEEFIDPWLDVAGGMPSAEAHVTSAGVEVTYTCGQDVTSNGEFLGVSIGSEVLPKKVDDWTRSVIKSIGEDYFELGYRGFFDVDFVLSKDGTPYAIESNMRRTGGTHTYGLMKLAKSDENTSCVFSYDAFEYGRDALAPKDILERAKELLYPMNNTNTGVVISLINLHDPILGYMVVGNNKKHMNAIRQQFMSLWA